jgi:hypothetical protein
MHKPLLVAICQFVCLNHHEKRKLTPDYDEGSLKANDLHFDPKKRYKGTKVQSNKFPISVCSYYLLPVRCACGPEFCKGIMMFIFVFVFCFPW